MHKFMHKFIVLGNEEDNTPVKQQLSQSSSIDDKSGESFRAETTPKQRLADATNPSKQSMESTKSQGAITKTSSDGFASKQEKRANYSESPALDELRSKRLARFGGEQTSPEKMDISGEPPYKKDGKNVANDSKSRCTSKYRGWLVKGRLFVYGRPSGSGGSAFCFPYNSVTVRRILFKFGRFMQ